MANQPQGLRIGAIVAAELNPAMQAVVVSVVPVTGDEFPKAKQEVFTYFKDKLAKLNEKPDPSQDDAAASIMVEAISESLPKKFEAMQKSEWDWILVESNGVPLLVSSEGLVVVGFAGKDSVL